jgi:hypothetical protein
MAIARCAKCGKPAGGNVTPPRYVDQAFSPVGLGSIVCGRTSCENDAQIWLKVDEARAYETGQRVFIMSTNTAKVRVQ